MGRALWFSSFTLSIHLISSFFVHSFFLPLAVSPSGNAGTSWRSWSCRLPWQAGAVKMMKPVSTSVLQASSLIDDLNRMITIILNISKDYTLKYYYFYHYQSLCYKCIMFTHLARWAYWVINLWSHVIHLLQGSAGPEGNPGPKGVRVSRIKWLLSFSHCTSFWALSGNYGHFLRHTFLSKSGCVLCSLTTRCQ